MVKMLASVAWLLLFSCNAFAWSKIGLVDCKAKDCVMIENRNGKKGKTLHL